MKNTYVPSYASPVVRACWLTCRHVTVQQRLCARYEAQIEHLTLALQEAQARAAESSRVAEEHRKMSANLNVALVTESAGRQALEREREKLKRALKEMRKKMGDLLDDRAATERVIARVFRELVECRIEAEVGRRGLQDEVVSLRRDVRTMEREAEDAKTEHVKSYITNQKAKEDLAVQLRIALATIQDLTSAAIQAQKAAERHDGFEKITVRRDKRMGSFSAAVPMKRLKGDKENSTDDLQPLAVRSSSRCAFGSSRISNDPSVYPQPSTTSITTRS